jgi:hypothetical protein
MTVIARRRPAARPVLVALLVLMFGADTLTESVIVSKFRKIYEEALPGMRLPTPTQFILDYQTLLVIAATGLLLVGIWLLYQMRTTWLWILFTVIAIQIGVTVVELFIPMTRLAIYASSQ